MKYFLLLLIATFLSVQVSHSQTCQWAQRINGTGADVANCTTVDCFGNVFVSGYYSSSVLNFNNGKSLTKNGNYDGYIAKYNSSGICMWVANMCGPGVDYASRIALDSSGNVYVAGYFSSSKLDFNNNISIINDGGFDAFIAKYNSIGICQWVEKFSGKGDERVWCIAFDGIDNIYIGGSFTSEVLSFNNDIAITNTNSGTSDAYISKYNTSGTCQWTQKISGSNHDHLNSIGIDGSGNIIVGGYFFSSYLNFNTGIALDNDGSYDVFIAKYNSRGKCLWADKIGGTGDDRSFSIAVDISGNISITGFYKSSVVRFNNGKMLTITGTIAGYLAQYSSDGTCQWAKKINGDAEDYTYSITSYGSGNIILAGSFSNPTLTFNNLIELTNSGSFDAFFAYYNSKGVCQWAEKISGIGEEKANSIVADLVGYLYIVGYYNSNPLEFNSNISLTNYYSTSIDAFVAKYKILPSNTITTSTMTDTSYCQGDSIFIPFTIFGKYINGNSFTAQLSDSSGNFANPISIGAISGLTAGMIKAAIPFSTAFGKGYKVRVVSSNPEISGADNGENITINKLPSQFLVRGGGVYCEGDQGVIIGLDSSELYVSYQLKLDSTNIGSTVNGTGSAIDFGYQNQNGKYTVEAKYLASNCASIMYGSKDATEVPIPPKPIISKTGNDLVSSAETGNQWYFNTQIIAGANNKIYTPTSAGKYSVTETQNHCSSPMSDLLDVIVDDVNDNSTNTIVSIIPSPNNGSFSLRIDNLPNTEMVLKIVNSIGQEVYNDKLTTTNEAFTKELNLNNISSGIYYLKLRFGDKEIVKPIIITK